VGDEAFVPNLASPTARFFNQPSTLQLQDGSFIRLRNLSIGYTVPQKSLGNQEVIRSARIYAMGQNLFLIKAKDFRGPDPEVSANGTNNLVQGESFFALPQARVFTVGVNFGF
jgi:TonB-dependent starch-binding outer membrane protein SusC